MSITSKMGIRAEPDLLVEPLLLGDEEEVSDMIYRCLDHTISKYCDPEVLSFLKHLYSPERIIRLITGPCSENRRIYLSRSEQQIRWTVSYENIERVFNIGMFYGQPNFSGARAARHILSKVESDLLMRNGSYMTGKVLVPARKFIEGFYNRKKEGEFKFSQPEMVTDIDPVTHKKVELNVLTYKYTPISANPPEIIGLGYELSQGAKISA